MLLHQHPQPAAGPSRPIYTPRRAKYMGPDSCDLEDECPLWTPLKATSSKGWAVDRRQDLPSASFTGDATSPSTAGNFSLTSASSAIPATDLTTVPIPSNNSSTYTDVYDTATQSFTVTTSSTVSPTLSSKISKPWQPSTKSTSSHAPDKTPYVPGVILPMTLGGDSDDEAVYSVSMDFGHSSQGSSQKRRAPSSTWNGGDPQAVNLQVDLGSSDLWVASTNCSSSDCKSAPALFNASQSLDSGFAMQFAYHSGEVSGEVYWEQVQLGGFGIGYQAFLAASDVESEDLGGANFTGVLGLALPANSIILSKIAGSTSGDPDGATFLDNLFGLGDAAPTQRLFSISLERREDVRTSSTFGIGAISEAFCPAATCSPQYIPIVSQPSLGTTGYLHWRLPLTGITAITWASDETGTGPSTQNITLGPSQVDTSRSTPLAVLDSGGVATLIGYKPWADAIYGAYGIASSSDGIYRMPCTQQIALAFQFGNQTFAAHPLDMTWPDPSDPSQTTCIGAIQYSANLGNAGDLVMGSSFLKNVYSIFQYPDNLGRGSWQPSVGMVSLTNASVASQDFYAVRVERQSLSSVSSHNSDGVGAPNPSASTTGSQSNSGGAAGRKVLSSAMIAGISVAALFIFAAAVFCAWWFWLRRRFGKDGKVNYPALTTRHSRGHSAAPSTGSTTRNKKHDAAQRQKSMIEGYSDYEDSWLSTTEGADSIRLGYIPEVMEERDGIEMLPRSGSSSVRHPSPRRTSDAQDISSEKLRHPSQPASSTSPEVPLRPLVDDALESPRYPPAYTYPNPSWSMSGPFPSPSRHSMARPDNSPMYDIRSSDYFDITPTPTKHGQRARGRTGADLSSRQRSSERDHSSSRNMVLMDNPLTGEIQDVNTLP